MKKPRPLCAMLAALAFLAPGSSVAVETRLPQHLDITVAVFDPGIADYVATESGMDVFPRIREAEARLLPFELRRALAATGDWGAVRVVPDSDPRAELLITATIVQSDGIALALALRAADSTGRVWLDDTYIVKAATGTGAAGKDDEKAQHYEALFDRVVADLTGARAHLSNKDLTTIMQVSLLRYAQALSADVFAGFLNDEPDGTVSIRRLPAEGDPMFERAQRIRQYEYVFIDTLDEQYNDAYAEVSRAYRLWRQYRRELAEYREVEGERLLASESDAPRGSYRAIKRSYDSFRWAKMEEQNLAKWADRFNNEVAPTVMDLDNRVIELRGGLDARYAEWRRILQSLFEVETGGAVHSR